MVYKVIMTTACFVGVVLAAGDIKLNRLTDTYIEKRAQEFVLSQNRNKVIRRYAKIGLSCLGVLGFIGGVSYIFKNQDGRIPVAEKPCVETLAKDVAELKERVSGPSFGSIGWLKSAGYLLLSNPGFLMTVAGQLGYFGLKCAQKIFYVPTISWFLANRTTIGLLREKSADTGNKLQTLVHGSLLRNLEYHAQGLALLLKNHPDKIERIEFHRQMIASLYNDLVNEVALVIAYMQCCPGLGVQTHPRYKNEAIQWARYLFNYINDMSITLQKALEEVSVMLSKPQGDSCPVLTLVKEIDVELEQVLVGLKRVEILE